MPRIVLIIVSLIIVHHGFAQSLKNEIQDADQLFEKQSFQEAANLYQSVLDSDRITDGGDQQFEVIFKLADCFGKLNNPSEEIAQLERIIESGNSTQRTAIIIKAYKRIGDIYLVRNLDEALIFSERYEAFAKDYGTKDNYAQALHYTCGIYNFLQDAKKAGEKALLAYQVAQEPKMKYEGLIYYASSIQNDSPQKADSLFLMSMEIVEGIGDSLGISSASGLYANFLLGRGELRKAADLTIKALDWKPRANIFDLGRVDFYCFLSEIFYALRNIERSEYYVQRAIDLSEINNYKSRNGLVAMLYGQVLNIKGETNLAYAEFEKAYSYFKERKIYFNLLIAVSELGILDVQKGELEKAKEKYNEAKQLLEFTQDDQKKERFYKLESYLNLALDNPQKALTAAELSYTLCLHSENSSCKLINLEIIKDCYTQLRQPGKALEYFEKYTQLKDSVFLSNQNAIVFDLESQYKRKEQDQSLALLNIENELAGQQLSRQTGIITVGGIALVLFSLLSFFLFQLNRKNRSQKKIIQKALSEKDVLLREIHHRVKNNLQLVSSLLTLQSRSITDERAIAAINDGKARVRSMALIHQDLYSKENLTGISVKHYIEKLGNEIFHTYNVSKEDVQLKLEVEDIDLDVETVVPLGLIINELITNSLKYAFPENGTGTILISLNEKNGKLLLKLKDDGIGLDTTAFNTSSSFGNRLVNILTEQLDGKLSVSSENGTSVSIEINSYNKAA